MVFHAVVAPGVALLAAGASGLQKAAAATNNNNNQDLVLVCVGIALLVGAWVMLCVGTALSFLPFRRQRQQKKNRENKVTDIGPAASVHRNGTKVRNKQKILSKVLFFSPLGQMGRTAMK